MKFDLTGKTAEELLARQQELSAEIPAEERDAMTVEEIEERADELEAIKAELDAREQAAKEAEETRQEVAESRLDPVIKEFTEEKKMENRFAIDSPEYRDAFLRNLQGKELTAEDCFKLNINTENWVYKDGWYYYTGIVQPGQETPQVFSHVEIV